MYHNSKNSNVKRKPGIKTVENMAFILSLTPAFQACLPIPKKDRSQFPGKTVGRIMSRSLSVKFPEYRPPEIVAKDVLHPKAFDRHHRGADLAEANTVAPSCPLQTEADYLSLPISFGTDNKGAAVEMAGRQPAADFQFLAYDDAGL
jgi:hypothetical protein